MPGRLAADGPEPFLSPDEVLAIARAGAAAGCLEALFTLGDRPEDRWPVAREWLAARGYDDTLAYVRAMAVLVLEETGLLPHLNPGVMSWAEMARLKPVAPSMGMMLETTSTRLFTEPSRRALRLAGQGPGRPAAGARGRRPAVDPVHDRACSSASARRSRSAPSRCSRSARRRARYGHVQEVIVQNFRAKDDTAMRATPDLEPDDYLAAVAVARRRARPGGAGAGAAEPVRARRSSAGCCRRRRRLGRGVPGDRRPRQPRAALAARSRRWPTCHAGGRLRAARAADGASALRTRGRAVARPPRAAHVAALADAATGLAARRTCRRAALAGARPDVGHGVVRRTDLYVEVDTIGPTDDRRSDFDAVYGDWDAVGDDARAALPDSCRRSARGWTATATSPRFGRRARPGRAAQQRTSTWPSRCSRPTAPASTPLCRLADDVRRDTVGDVVTYVVNRNINFTNVCYVGCRFCAFAQRRTDADAYSLSLAEVADRVREAWDVGRDRDLHAGRHRPRPARHRLPRPRRGP